MTARLRRFSRLSRTLSAGLLGLVVGAALVVGTAGCRSEAPAEGDERPRFAVTLPPLAMIVEPVVGERGVVETILEPGDSPHTYDPRPSDVRSTERSRAVVFGAPSLDGWAADLPARRRWAMLEMVAADQRRALGEGETHHASHRHSGRRVEASGDAASLDGVDPHFWTDPAAVKSVLPALVDSLCAADAGGCPVYRANADSFATRLDALDARLETMLRPVRHTPVMLAQPFFRYFTGRYGPTVVAVVEPSPAKEPSPRRIRRLVDEARTARVQGVFTQHQLPPRAAEVVAEAARLPIHTLDPLGGTDDRRTYDALLLHNARVLLDALSGE